MASEQTTEHTIEDCIFDWKGRPNCETESLQSVACGIPPMQTLTFKRCAFGGTLSFHDNFWQTACFGEKPFLANGCKVNIIDCIFNNNSIGFVVRENIGTDVDTYEQLNISGCFGINGLTIAKSSDSVTQKLIFNNFANDIKTVVNPF